MARNDEGSRWFNHLSLLWHPRKGSFPGRRCLSQGPRRLCNQEIAFQKSTLKKREPAYLESATGGVDLVPRIHASHTRTDSSLEPDAIHILSLEITTDWSKLVWPLSTCRCAPVNTSHIRTFLSNEPDTIRRQSIESATDVTEEVLPLSTSRFTPVRASQIRTVGQRCRNVWLLYTQSWFCQSRFASQPEYTGAL
jgi:hypothetical protein